MFKNGITKINSAIDVFVKVEKKLEEGVKICTGEIIQRTEQIKRLDSEIGEISTSKKRAEKVIGKLQEMLG